VAGEWDVTDSFVKLSHDCHLLNFVLALLDSVEQNRSGGGRIIMTGTDLTSVDRQMNAVSAENLGTILVI